MLARLDAVPGVMESRAECSGRYFLVVLSDPAPRSTAARIAETLGRGARVLAPEEAEPQHAARRRGEPWVNAAEARALSFIESRIVAARAADAAAAGARLSLAERERVAEAVREEMFDHVERLLAGEGEPGRFFQDWPALADRATARCAASLDAERAAIVRERLLGLFGAPRCAPAPTP